MTAQHSFVIGIDEVGRGPLAGMLLVAGVMAPKRFNLKAKISAFEKKSGIQLRDSKKLTEKERVIWFRWVKTQKKLIWAFSTVTPKVIDRMNIYKAASLGAYRVAEKLTRTADSCLNYSILMDGSLYIRKILKPVPRKISTIVKGDEKIPLIALASIMAKVTRDEKMKKFHDRYPGYGFLKNKGYGTQIHLKALKKYGPCPIHRLTFIKKHIKIQNIQSSKNTWEAYQ